MGRVVWFQSDVEKRTAFESIMVKHFLLTLLSIVSMLIMLLYIFIGAGIPEAAFEDYRVIVGQFIVGFDLLSNFVSVIFGFGFFQKYYSLLCGCCHRSLTSSLSGKVDAIKQESPSTAEIKSVDIAMPTSPTSVES